MPVILSWKNLFNQLPNIALAYASKKLGHEVEALLDALNALELGIPKGKFLDWLTEYGWLDAVNTSNEARFNNLIQAALVRALTELVISATDMVNVSPNSAIAKMKLPLSELPEVTMEARFDFLNDPTALQGYTDFRDALEQWFTDTLKLSLNQAKATAQRLDSFFIKGLFDELDTSAERYVPLVDLLNNPFHDSEVNRRKWLKYNATLHASLDETVLDELFTLRQIYMPLRAYWVERITRKVADNGESTTFRFRHISLITNALEKWLLETPKGLRVLSAGPGAGKTTVARMLANDIIRKHDRRVLFIPLKDFKINEGMHNALEHFLESSFGPGVQCTVTEFLKTRPFVIFDGMDELAIQHVALKEKLEYFIRDVEDWAKQDGVHVLLTGREYLLQSQTSLHRNHTDEIWHLMPYHQEFASKTVVNKNQYDSLKEKEWDSSKFTDVYVSDTLHLNDTRDTWWKCYTQLTGRTKQDFPNNIRKLEQLKELSTQPLLLLLLAQAYFSKQDRGEKIDESTNLNSIYDELIQRIFIRNRKKKVSFMPDLTQKEYELFLECCAMACWHNSSGGRIAELISIKEQLKLYEAEHLLGEGIEESGLMPKLLTSFYLRNPNDVNLQNKVEFTHKSFGEYLVARRLFKLINDLIWSEHEKTQKEALITWFQATMPSDVDADLNKFIKAEAQRQLLEVNKVNQNKICKILSLLVKHNGLPYDLKDLSGKPFHILHREMCNAEQSLLVIHSAIAAVTQEQSDLKLEKELLRSWFVRVTRGFDDSISRKALCLLNLSGINLYFANLRGADFRKTALRGAVLRGAVLYGADLTGANLRGADLRGADLGEACLKLTDLTGANLRGANLRGAIWGETRLQDAQLMGALLGGADLGGIDLRRADLTGADLKGANLSGANLRGAKLNHTNLVGVNLKWADLNFTEFKGSRLKRAQIFDSWMNKLTLSHQQRSELTIINDIKLP